MTLPYRLCTLYSGSTGNAAYLETPHARILIDAGKCTRTLLASLKAIGVEANSIDAIFITHDHNDHISALEVLTKKYPIPVHMLYKCALRYRDTASRALCECLHMYRTPEEVDVAIGNVRVTAFKTPHDSRDSMGFSISVAAEDGSHRIGYATDIGYISEDVRMGLLGCETVVLESNHDEEMLKNGLYPYDLKVRILSHRGHLSNCDCANFACELYESGMRHLLLAHLSEHNNVPDIAYDETACALAGLDVDLKVASPCEVTMLVGDAAHPIEKQSLEVVL
ncbi:MAG: MBL fold metallo-hydrolase [Ruminococcaceae bacterium]|nr:MBL fold metallo-hydrolase [Oscillospiraceae bacterium]